MGERGPIPKIKIDPWILLKQIHHTNGIRFSLEHLLKRDYGIDIEYHPAFREDLKELDSVKNDIIQCIGEQLSNKEVDRMLVQMRLHKSK